MEHTDKKILNLEAKLRYFKTHSQSSVLKNDMLKRLESEIKKIQTDSKQF